MAPSIGISRAPPSKPFTHIPFPIFLFFFPFLYFLFLSLFPSPPYPFTLSLSIHHFPPFTSSQRLPPPRTAPLDASGSPASRASLLFPAWWSTRLRPAAPPSGSAGRLRSSPPPPRRLPPLALLRSRLAPPGAQFDGAGRSYCFVAPLASLFCGSGAGAETPVWEGSA
jgi:hypothetical protein